MIDNVRVVYVDVEHDWEGLYVNGTLYAEGHEILPSTYLNVMREYDVEETERYWVQFEDDRSDLPNREEELRAEILNE